MAKRSNLTEEDLTIIEETVSKQIQAELKTEGIEMLAPLFRVREKVLAMKAGRSDKGATRKATPAAKTRSSARNSAPVNNDDDNAAPV